jgi:protoporphyrinogen/coproporphyrinogen III oxidase
MSNNFINQQSKSPRVAIIGGGITGLAAAHRLIERSREIRPQVNVLLLESSSRLGGIIQTEGRDGFLLERGPDSFISEKPEAIDLAKRIGLESHLIETNRQHRRSFIVRNRSLRPVPDGFQLLAPSRFWPFITTDIFSWAGKARMAMDLVLPRANTNGNADESLANFVRRRFGTEALERMAQPMVGGIYTADPEKLSLRATFPRFLEMEREHGSVIRALRRGDTSPTASRGSSPTPGSPAAQRRWGGSVREGSEIERGTSGPRYSLFLSFDLGMQMLVDKLDERIADYESRSSNVNHWPPTSIQLNTAVESLSLQRGQKADSGAPVAVSGEPLRWKVRTNRNETFIAEAVCLALPAYVSARLLKNVDCQLASELNSIPYESTAIVNLAYQREDISHLLDGFGFVVPFIEKRSLIACTFSSVKFPNRAPEGHVLLRAFVGGALQPEKFALDEGEIIQRVRDDLRDLLGIETPPLFTEVAKWHRSMPQYHVGHLERVKRIDERVAALPGLVLAGNAYLGIGIPDCIRSGETAARRILSSLRGWSSFADPEGNRVG